MGRKAMTRTQKFLNALLRGESVSWTAVQKTYGFKSPRTVVDGFRKRGFCVYANKKADGTYYRIGTPSADIVKAGLASVYAL
ncbi:MAG: hypothetical protein CBE47_00850 [Pelagibacteraceae bacterium TMED287]|jgi:hypothetical protein|nr:MAG: hypothetical protein CBE47_00850 [Pelagibacteraceae bacterium TMED287]|tara:strand:+ start:48 stop:293 length:246 start_codon:yes stop_codon:yes gene_type:complete